VTNHTALLADGTHLADALIAHGDVRLTALFGPELQRDFTLVTDEFVAPGLFRPVSDVATAPTLLYIRTTELSR